uniref:Uncharacterized protein n=1 Tax=Timema bartmani TaxID=61472 RepID=A0A7R9I5F5_9NEOP|nr:unnamed protein product [Timema bartmani]
MKSWQRESRGDMKSWQRESRGDMKSRQRESRGDMKSRQRESRGNMKSRQRESWWNMRKSRGGEVALEYVVHQGLVATLRLASERGTAVLNTLQCCPALSNKRKWEFSLARENWPLSEAIERGVLIDTEYSGELVTDGSENMKCGVAQAIEGVVGAVSASVEERYKGLLNSQKVMWGQLLAFVHSATHSHNASRIRVLFSPGVDEELQFVWHVLAKNKKPFTDGEFVEEVKLLYNSLFQVAGDMIDELKIRSIDQINIKMRVEKQWVVMGPLLGLEVEQGASVNISINTQYSSSRAPMKVTMTGPITDDLVLGNDEDIVGSPGSREGEEVLRHFIEQYELPPELCNLTNPLYSKKAARNSAFDLIPILMRIKPGANKREDVKKKPV